MHVIGIPFPCQEKELREHFGECGHIVQCDIKQSKGGSNKGHATIAYTNPQVCISFVSALRRGSNCDLTHTPTQQAQAAVDKLHRSDFQEHSLTVDLYRHRAARGPQQPLTADAFANQFETGAKHATVELPKPKKIVMEKPPEKKDGEQHDDKA